MTRFHVNVSVADLDKSVDFYTTLFGKEPTLLKGDYAKWMLDDPRVNFAVSKSQQVRGINHVGLQVDSADELGEIQARLREAEQVTLDQENVQCCYARSSKTWVRDPDNVAWETFVTYGQTTRYGEDLAPTDVEAETSSPNACC